MSDQTTPPATGEATPLPNPNQDIDIEAIAARHQGALTPAEAVEAVTGAPPPEAPAPAPSAAEKPAKAAEAPTPVPAAAAPKGRLAPMLRRERELVTREQELKGREAAIVAKALAERDAEFQRDPGAFMARLNMKPDQVALRLVAPEKGPAANPLAEEVKSLKATVDELRGIRERAEAEAAASECIGELTNLMEAEPDRWPLTKAAGYAPFAYRQMLSHYEEHDEVLGDEEVLDAIETDLAALRDKLIPRAELKAPAPRQATKGPRTTSNQVAASATGKGKEVLPENDDQLLEHLAARAERQLREGRQAGR